MHQPSFRGKKFRIKGGKLVPAPKSIKVAPRARATRAEIARAAKKNWDRLMRVAREYTAKRRHVNVAELIVYFHYKKISLPEATAKKLLEEIARSKRK